MRVGGALTRATPRPQGIRHLFRLVQGGQGVFGIAVGRVWQEVEGTLAHLPSEEAPAEDIVTHPGDELAERRSLFAGRNMPRGTGSTMPAYPASTTMEGLPRAVEVLSR